MSTITISASGTPRAERDVRKFIIKQYRSSKSLAGTAKALATRNFKLSRRVTADLIKAILIEEGEISPSAAKPATPTKVKDRITELRAEELGWKEIARALNAEGITNARGAAWTDGSVRHLAWRSRVSPTPSQPRLTDDERFESKVEPRRGHLFWTGSTDGNGYAKLALSDGSLVFVHRYAWERENGPLGNAKLVNLCNERTCITPAHWAIKGSSESVFEIDPKLAALRATDDPFWTKVEQLPGSGCWLWTGRKHEAGYGRRLANGGPCAHKESYEKLVGPVPEGCVLHHAAWCESKLCLNPLHLTPVLRAQHAKLDKAEKLIEEAYATGALQDELWLYTTETEDDYQARLLSRIGAGLADLELSWAAWANAEAADHVRP